MLLEFIEIFGSFISEVLDKSSIEAEISLLEKQYGKEKVLYKLYSDGIKIKWQKSFHAIEEDANAVSPLLGIYKKIGTKIFPAIHFFDGETKDEKALQIFKLGVALLQQKETISTQMEVLAKYKLIISIQDKKRVFYFDGSSKKIEEIKNETLTLFSTFNYK